MAYIDLFLNIANAMQVIRVLNNTFLNNKNFFRIFYDGKNKNDVTQ